MNKDGMDRLDELEILAAHQARLLEELNEVVIRQGKDINRLERIAEALAERFQRVEDNVRAGAPLSKPPHW